MEQRPASPWRGICVRKILNFQEGNSACLLLLKETYLSALFFPSLQALSNILSFLFGRTKFSLIFIHSPSIKGSDISESPNVQPNKIRKFLIDLCSTGRRKRKRFCSWKPEEEILCGPWSVFTFHASWCSLQRKCKIMAGASHYLSAMLSPALLMSADKKREEL